MQTCRQGNELNLWLWVCDAHCQPVNYSALTWRTILFTELNRAWQIYTFANLIVKFSFSALSKRKHPNVSVLRPRATNWVTEWESSTLGDPESTSCERVGSHEECNLFESSMVSSSLILFSFSMLQGFCSFTKVLFIWWLWNYMKPRFVNLTKYFSEMRCIGRCISCK